MKCADGAFHSFFPDDLHTLELSFRRKLFASLVDNILLGNNVERNFGLHFQLETAQVTFLPGYKLTICKKSKCIRYKFSVARIICNRHSN